ncbi:TetR/AcrR family transcriptional regulator [Sandarakinorhabdus oryzae]|uniref:TetR/AcrR family transcriptional regulator n=1 Tax=Sandarakinorhabdus oryzae TaxID=2675220 RepID=UPI0018CC528E|nr:TetR/AcrR family transcriptional regulator [Sandarakinorhabdus oryzae]
MSSSQGDRVRSRRTPEAARANILLAAEDLLRSEGPDNFRLAEVARRAGTTHSNVIAHFGSVIALQRHTAARIAHTLIGEIAARMQEQNLDTEPVHDVVQTLFAALALPSNRRLFAWIFLHDQAEPLPGVAEALLALRDITQRRLLARGKVSAADPAVAGRIIQLVIAAAVGQAMAGRYVESLAPDAPDALPGLITQLLYEGLA